MEKEHLEVILEDIRGKFDLVLDGHEVLRREIREVRDESNARHDHTAFLIGALNDKIDGVEARLDQKIDRVEAGLSQRIDAVETSLGQRIDAVEGTLTQTKLSLGQKIEQLDVSLTETKMSLGQKIDALAADLAAHRADTEAHHGVYRVREE
jgi:hypothetical protein